jgi:hypothetical protein
MKTSLRFGGIAGVILIGLAACGGGSAASGRYVAEMPGMGDEMALDFHKDGTATLTMGGQDVDCTYEEGEKRIAVSCFGSSGFSLTPLDNGDLEGDMGGAIVHYKKR